MKSTENESLMERRQYDAVPELKPSPRADPERSQKPSRSRLVLISVGILALLALLFAIGYLPRRNRNQELAAGVTEKKESLPEVSVSKVKVAPANSDLLLPGNITPITEAALSARADGFLRKRYVDIGDHVRKGQLLAELESPELDQQVEQARAGLSQTRAALSRAQHGVTQATSNLHLAEVTVQRWKILADRGVVSRQEFDQKQAEFESQQATVQSAQADVRAAEDNVRASEANVQRLVNLQGYERIIAPFSGIITARNVDVGSLISSNGSTPLFRMAQIDALRIMIQVPEQSSPYIRVGEAAEITLQEFSGRKFMGKVSRTANALDANTRTLPTEVMVPNKDGVLLPNMYAQVNLIGSRVTPAILIPGDALIAGSKGTQVALVNDRNRIHFQKVEVGRDYGPEIEIRQGLAGGETVVVNPSDDVNEGAAVQPVMQKQGAAPGQKGAPTGGARPPAGSTKR
ncbi:MAG: efflux RND transporter periplasmic adaptor subunit [Acidobacteriota bacterium]|nr:efflux RND transporter periplasmic adaptor subunit [Acidobacteriota bacterium]